MNFRAALLPAMALAVLAGPIGASAQASFDCRRATTPTEMSICEDPVLAGLDRQLNDTFRVVLGGSDNPDALRRAQGEWLSNIQSCGADERCIGKAYSDRMAELSPPPDSELVETATNEAPPILHSDAAPLNGALQAEQPYASDNPRAEEVSAPAQSAPQPDGDDSTALRGGAMILGLIVAGLIAIWATKALADYSINRFGWPMILNWWNILHLISIFAFLGAISVGAPLAGVVIAGGLWLIVLFVNIRKTNLLAGLAMTILQPFLVFIMWAIDGVMKAKTEGRRI